MAMTVAPEIESRIREKIESGLFESVDEVLNEALALLDREEEHLKRQKLRALIEEGFEGPFTPLTRESWDEGLARVRKQHFARKAAMPSNVSSDADS